MANNYKGEIQDSNGNVVYPHTESDIVFCTDGKTVQEKLTNYENALGDVTGKTDSLEVSDSNILATSKAVNILHENLGNLKFAQDAEGKWGYIPSGADTVIPFKSDIEITSYTEVAGIGTYTVIEEGYYLAMVLDCSSSKTPSSSFSTTGTIIFRNSSSVTGAHYNVAFVKAVVGDTITISAANTHKKGFIIKLNNE